LQAVHVTDVVDYVYNNAGIAGGNSFLDESPEGRAAWEKTFNVDCASSGSSVYMHASS
jgi:hypothetical protein